MKALRGVKWMQRLRLRVGVVLAGALLVSGFLGSGPGAAAARPAALTGVHVFGWGFVDPDAIASEGAHVWVANLRGACSRRGLCAGNSVSELSASTGSLVKTISSARYKFDDPDAMALNGANVWVVNGGGDSVTELSATSGALVRVISGSSDHFYQPKAIASDRTHMWVLNAPSAPGANSFRVTELSAATGRLVRTIPLPLYHAIDGGPKAIASDGTHVWVASGGLFDYWVTELNASTGGVVRVISGSRYKFANPDAIASDGTHVWVANRGGSVTELSASTGGVIRVISLPKITSPAPGTTIHPDAIAVVGARIWVAASPTGCIGCLTIGSITELQRLDRLRCQGALRPELQVLWPQRHSLGPHSRLGAERGWGGDGAGPHGRSCQSDLGRVRLPHRNRLRQDSRLGVES